MKIEQKGLFQKTSKGESMDDIINREGIILFDFKCPHCKSQDIDMRSLKIEYRPDTIDNSDLNHFVGKEAERLNHLPTIGSSILMSDSTDLIVACNNCKIASRIDGDIDKRELRKWVKVKYGEGTTWI